MLRLVRPWDSQPQEAVGVDWSNPLTNGLAFSAALSSGSSFRDVVAGRSGGVSGTVITRPSGIGTAAKFDGSSNLDYGSGDIISSTSPFTITLFEETDVVGGFNSLFAFSAGSTRFVMYRGTGASYTCAIGTLNGGSTVREFNSLGIQTAGEKIRFVITGTGGLGSNSGLRLWANGVEQTSVTTSLSASGGNNTIGWGGVNSKFNGKIADVNLLARAWSDSEVAQYFQSPHQLFAPRTIYVPVSAGGGGPTYTLTSDAGNLTLTGNAAALTAQRKVAANVGAYTLTGNAAGLTAQRKLTAAAGSYALTGNAAALTAQRKLTAAAGAYALTGADAALTYTPVGTTYSLSAEAGSFALAGNAAALTAARKIAAAAGAYTLTGNDATLTYTPRVLSLIADAGSFALTGGDATLTYSGYVAPAAVAGGGGWLPSMRRKTRKQIHEERIKLGILPPDVVKAAKKAAAVVADEPAPVMAYKQEPEQANKVFLRELGATKMLPDYTRAIQAQIEIQQREDEDLMLYF